MRKIIILVVALIALVGVAFGAKVMLERPSDPQNFVNTALATSLDIDSAKFQSAIQIAGDGGAMGNGQVVMNVGGSVTNATAYLPTLDYQIDLDVVANVLGQAVSGGTNLGLKIVDEVIYGTFSEIGIQLADAPEEIIEQINTINAFAGKWYAISIAKLRESDPEIAKVFEEQKAQQLEMRESLRNIFATNDLLLVKRMPLSFGDMQPVEVVLNTDFLTSDEFLDEFERMFTPAGLPEDAENPFAMTEEDKANLRQALSALGEQIDSTITLHIGKKDTILYGYTATLDFDLANLELPLPIEGNVSIVLNSQISEVNEPQTVEAPTEFEEIDPIALIPTPIEEELTDEEIVVETE